MATVNVRFKIRGRTAAAWTASNEVLLEREMGVETDTGRHKFGDGVTGWNALAYPTSAVAAPLAQIAALVPANDDILQRKGGAWTSRTLAQFKADLAYGSMALESAANFVPKAGGTFTGPLAVGWAGPPVNTLDVRAAAGSVSIRIADLTPQTLGFLAAASGIMGGASSASLGIRAEAGLEFSGGGNARHLSITTTGAVNMGGTNNVIDAARAFQLRSYTVATVPTASPAGRTVYVSNESGGAVQAFSDGTSWRRVTDRAVIS